MAISRRFCVALIFVSLVLFHLCLADERNKGDDSNTKTIRGKDVSARIQGRSGKIMIVRSDEDDKDDGKDGQDRDMDSDSDSKGSKDGKDSADSKDSPDSDDKKDDDDKDRPDADDKDDKDDDKDDDDFRDDNDDLLSFELDELKEKDSDGNEVDDKHSVDSFSDVNFQFSPVKKGSRFHGVSVINVNLTANLAEPKTDLGIMVYLFLEAGSIRFGNETFSVQPGTVKFNIKISNWDFCEDSSLACSSGKAGQFLDLSLKIKSKGSPATVDDDDRKKAVCEDKDDDKDDQNDKDDDNDNDDDDCPIIYDMGGDSEMLLNKGVMTDDSDYTAMPMGFPKFEHDDGTKKFVFRIPKFSKNALVDPSVTPGKKSAAQQNAASWLQINFTLALLIQGVAMFAAH